MLQVVLIRPGSTEYDQQGRIQGTLNIPLSDEGHREVISTVKEISDQPWKMETIYTTSCQAAIETAKLIAKTLEIKYKKLDKLKNLNHGLWQGMLIEDVKTKHPKVYRQWQEQPEKVCPPQGETVGSAKERTRLAISKLLRKHKEGVVGVVAPEPLASLVRHVLRHDVLADLWKRPNHNRWEIIAQPSITICD